VSSYNLWFLVADERRARVLAYDRKEDAFDAPLDADYVASGLKAGEQLSDRAGRVHERVGHGRHGMEPTSDPTRTDARDLARRVARDLGKAVHRGDASELVLVASPRTLGDLREILDAPTRAAVVDEHDKELTRLSAHELRERLREMVPPRKDAPPPAPPAPPLKPSSGRSR
jgi:protein required for attachment to host cells